MEVFIYKRADDSIVIRHPLSGTVDTMMGDGGKIAPSDVERTIAKKMITTETEAEFKRGWEAFLEARKGTPKEVIARDVIEGVAFGGLTRTEALRRIAAKVPSGCVNCATVDDTDLPNDRYFRSAWEWSD